MLSLSTTALWDISKLAPVAQLDRASDFYSVCWGFESLRARHLNVTALVTELVDVADLKSAGECRAGSTPVEGTNLRNHIVATKKKHVTKYKHVREFLVKASPTDSDQVGSSVEYSIPTTKYHWHDDGTSIKLSDCNRAVFWEIRFDQKGEAKLARAISILQGALKDVQAARKLGAVSSKED